MKRILSVFLALAATAAFATDKQAPRNRSSGGKVCMRTSISGTLTDGLCVTGTATVDPVGGFGTTTDGAASASLSGIVTTGNQVFAGRKSAGNSHIRLHLASNVTNGAVHAAATRLPFDTADFDTNSECDVTSSKGLCTMTHAGKYLVCFKAGFDVTTSVAGSTVQINKNSTRFGAMGLPVGITNPTAQVCDLLTLNASDTIDGRVFNNEAADKTFDANANDPGANYLTIDEVL